MNELKLSWNLFSIKPKKDRYNFALFIPFLGISTGIFLLLITFGIMEGMEKTIYTDLQKFLSSEKLLLNNFSKSNIKEISTILENDNVSFYRTLERKCIIKNAADHRLIDIRAIEKLDTYIKNNFSIDINQSSDNPSIIIGSGLSNLLNISQSNIIELFSPSDINLFTSIPPNEKFTVEKPYDYLLLDFDTNYGFISLNDGRRLFKNSGNDYLYFQNELSDETKEIILNKFPESQFIKWKKDYHELIEAMRMEKILYSFFGIIIIILASFTLMNIMSNTIYRKIHQFGILKVMGFTQKQIQNFTLQYSLLTGIISISFGIILSLIFVDLDNRFHILQQLFKEMLIVEFNIFLDPMKMFIASLCGIIIVSLSAFYPTYSTGKLKIINTLDNF